ncbi:class I SAM-dependent methyltransferase [Acidithiobacillus caldus]|uniref:class I SAM-dependent methyltransferase n=1 Tax=Acidithiobacillus caldus TaxID=33059 RepID=UPI000674C497|nr:class I SAM-dependent methyltransferase [Acidithiobacillus caldus]
MSIERRGALTVKHSESDTRTESGADDRRARWRSRYSELADTPLPPAHTLLQRWVQAPQQGTALDLACGRGQDALYLARCGFDTEAWDLAEPAIAELSERAQGLCLRARVRDVLAEPPAESTFDCLHVANFLARPARRRGNWPRPLRP